MSTQANQPGQSFDLREELVNGDPSRQSRALLAVLGLLSAGREVGPYISLICQSILGNPNVAPTARATAYDVVAAATPSDSDCARIGAAIGADLQSGTPPELRVKAMGALSMLPSHRLLGMLGAPALRGRLGAALRHPAPALRAAAAQALLALLGNDAVAAAAFPALAPAGEALLNKEEADTAAGIAALFEEAVDTAAEGLADDDAAVVSAVCRALPPVLGAVAPAGGDADASAPAATRAVGEAARAAGARSVLAARAVTATSAAFPAGMARFRALPLAAQCEVPPFLCAYLKAVQGAAGEQKSLDALPGDAAGTKAHAFEESAALLSELVRCGDPPAVFAAAQGLFELAEADVTSAALQALLPSAIAAAVGAAAAAGTPQRAVAQHAVLNLLLRYLDVLPNVQRAALFPRLPPMIAGMPAGADRVRAFYLLWSAVAAYDWAPPPAPPTRARGAPPPAPPTPQLQQILVDPHVKEAVAGAAGDAPSPAGPPPHPRFKDPVFREEMVGSLLYVLLTHPRPAAAVAGGAAGGPTAASSAVARASAVQAAAAAVDWLVTAKGALQGTKACLGWDRMAGVPTTGCTAAADLWLQLLLRCIQTGAALKARLGAAAATAEPAAGDGNAGPAGADADPGAAALAALVRRAGELDGDVQGMLLQIAANWRALHPVVRPRAVWLCACHLRLRSAPDAAWTALADAVHGLLVDARAAETTAGGAASLLAAVGEGRLGPPPDGGDSGGRHEAGVAAGAGEAEEVALLALERLAALVASNHTGKLQGQLAGVAGLLERLAAAGAAGAASHPAAAERLARVGELLKPAATAGKEKGKKGSADGEGAAPVVVELTADGASGGSGGIGGGGAMAAASYPSTLPTAAALFSSPESARYRKFLEQLQAAALAKSVAAGGGAAAVAAAARARGASGPAAAAASGPSGGLPTFQQLSEALEGGTLSASAADAAAAVEVTGPAAPVTLSLTHSVDPGAGTIRLRCCATNRTTQSLSGVAVTLLTGGPVSRGRRPLTFSLATLPAGDVSVWEVPLMVTGFGWPVVQPAVTLPASVPAGHTPTLRCRPYAVSPLQLLAPPARALSPAEFYQRWQAMPHKTVVAAAPAEAGPLGVQRALAAVEAAGLTCVMKAVVPVAGGVHAAFHGAAWSGESIAVVVTSAAEAPRGDGAAARAALRFHFGSEAAEVVSHVRGHEGDLLAQLTAGAAVPAAGAGGEGINAAAPPAGAQAAEEEDRPARVSTFSFLRSVTAQMEAERGGDEDGDADAAAAAAASEAETAALNAAAVEQWQRVRALRVAM